MATQAAAGPPEASRGAVKGMISAFEGSGKQQTAEFRPPPTPLRNRALRAAGASAAPPAAEAPKPAAEQAAREKLQEKLREEMNAALNRQLETLMSRMSKEQEGALKEVQALQERSLELEREVERRKKEKEQQRLSLASQGSSSGASSCSGRRSVGSEGRPSMGSLAPMTPRSAAVYAMRRMSTDSQVSTSLPSTPRSARSSTSGVSASASEMHWQRRWMMEQRAMLLADLYPEGDPFKPQAARSAASRKSQLPETIPEAQQSPSSPIPEVY